MFYLVVLYEKILCRSCNVFVFAVLAAQWICVRMFLSATNFIRTTLRRHLSPPDSQRLSDNTRFRLRRMIATAQISPGFSVLPLSITHLSLSVVLKCGQSFRWTHHIDPVDAQSEWRLTLSDRVVCLRQTPETVLYKALYPSEASRINGERSNPTLSWLRDYFQLDVDLLEVFSEVKDPVFQAALASFEGAIRMLRQDPWENLIS